MAPASAAASYWEGIDYVAGTDRITFVERLYAVATDVLAMLDGRCEAVVGDGARGPAGAQDATLRSQALAALGRKLQDVRDFYAKAAPKRARLRYLAGVAAGVVVTVVLGGLLFLFLWGSHVVSIQDRSEIIAIWIAGAIGAVVSVMQRVSSESLELHSRSRKIGALLTGCDPPAAWLRSGDRAVLAVRWRNPRLRDARCSPRWPDEQPRPPYAVGGRRMNDAQFAPIARCCEVSELEARPELQATQGGGSSDRKGTVQR